MPSDCPISPDRPRFCALTLAVASKIDGLLRRLEDMQQDATVYIEIGGGKLKRGNVKLEIDCSDAQ